MTQLKHSKQGYEYLFSYLKSDSSSINTKRLMNRHSLMSLFDLNKIYYLFFCFWNSKVKNNTDNCCKRYTAQREGET